VEVPLWSEYVAPYTSAESLSKTLYVHPEMIDVKKYIS
jgi:hypothetical protein